MRVDLPISPRGLDFLVLTKHSRKNRGFLYGDCDKGSKVHVNCLVLLSYSGYLVADKDIHTLFTLTSKS